MAHASSTTTPRHPIVSMLASESSVYGVVLVSGLLVILANQADTPAVLILLKVLGTSVVFWLAHVYAGTVAHLGDELDDGEVRGRVSSAIRHSLGHLWGMLLAPVVLVVVLGVSLVAPITEGQAIWAALWVNVGLLAVLGFWGVSRWSNRMVVRVAGALITAAFGLALVLLKALIH